MAKRAKAKGTRAAPGPFRVSAAEWPTEADLAAAVDSQVMAAHATDIRLLSELANQANNELARLSGVVQIRDEADYFRLVMLSQTTNAAWAIVRMLRSGYPRVALSTARLLREGHVAILWAKVLPDQARACWRGMGDAGPSWPTAGAMAIAVKDALKDLSGDAARRWAPFIEAVGRTHNRSFAHAVTEFALAEGFIQEGSVITPIAGPTYLPQLTQMAVDHCVPLFKLLLHDAANMFEELGGDVREKRTETLLEQADEHWKLHPIPLDALPMYPEDEASVR